MLYNIIATTILFTIFIHPAKGQKSLVSGAEDNSSAEILIGPNLPVSSNNFKPHIETQIAVNPDDDSNLVGASVTLFNRFNEGSPDCNVFASTDGGYTWTEIDFPDTQERGVGMRGIDPQVAFGPGGTAYFVMPGRTPQGLEMPFYSSRDGGLTWTKTINLKAMDHPQMTVDPGSKRFAGRIYISAGGGLFYSSDGGRTFSELVMTPMPEDYHIFNEDPLVLSDGTLFLPYRAWNKNTYEEEREMETMFTTSTDGGKSFSSYQTIAKHPSHQYTVPEQFPGSFINKNISPAFAVDRAVHKDRIYVAWSDTRHGGGPRFFLTYSDDRGQAWSTPKPVSPDVPDESAQFQVMLAVARNGTVGISWFDTRDFPDKRSFHVYFSASTDGGDTFLPAKRVTTAAAIPYNEGNLRFGLYGISGTADSVGYKKVNFISSYSRWPDGGDYMGMTATEDTFFPLWTDNRNGASQLMTSPIQVLTTAEPKRHARSEDLKERVVTSEIELIWEQPLYDKKTQLATFPVRLRNKGEKTIYEPILVHIDDLEHFSPPALERAKNLEGSMVTDSSLIIDYTSAMGDFPSLRPGATTGVVDWKLKYFGIRERPNLKFRITGREIPDR